MGDDDVRDVLDEWYDIQYVNHRADAAERARAQYRADERKRRADFQRNPVPDYWQRFDDDVKLHVALDIATDIGPDCG